MKRFHRIITFIILIGLVLDLANLFNYFAQIFTISVIAYGITDYIQSEINKRIEEVKKTKLEVIKGGQNHE